MNMNIPFTSTLFLNDDQVPGALDVRSNQPIAHFHNLVCHTSGIEGNHNEFFNLDDIIEWVQAHGKDPMTSNASFPIDLRNYEAVFLNVAGESLSERISRNHKDEIFLLDRTCSI